MKKFEKLSESKFNTLENGKMSEIKGGRAVGGCTLNTVTVYSNGSPSKDDGDDSYSGECGGTSTK